LHPCQYKYCRTYIKRGWRPTSRKGRLDALGKWFWQGKPK
jgi:hypothetical protein